MPIGANMENAHITLSICWRVGLLLFSNLVHIGVLVIRKCHIRICCFPAFPIHTIMLLSCDLSRQNHLTRSRID